MSFDCECTCQPEVVLFFGVELNEDSKESCLDRPITEYSGCFVSQHGYIVFESSIQLVEELPLSVPPYLSEAFGDICSFLNKYNLQATAGPRWYIDKSVLLKGRKSND